MANYSQSESTISRGKDSVASKDASQLDSAGQAILKLLHKVADAAEANSRQALEAAQRLSSQLRAAEDRIAGLEAGVQQYRENGSTRFPRKLRIALLASRKRGDDKCRDDHKAFFLASTMSKKEQIHRDGNRPATLHNGAKYQNLKSHSLTGTPASPAAAVMVTSRLIRAGGADSSQ
jgi:hypothetical protein